MSRACEQSSVPVKPDARSFKRLRPGRSSSAAWPWFFWTSGSSDPAPMRRPIRKRLAGFAGDAAAVASFCGRCGL
jgi:hypothetical protein